nr:bucky ball-like [Nothobranchius furzeri]
MDDSGKPPHSFENGAQRSPHTRPFFYVQPPSQPYYLYQHWQLNNPYGHFGLPAGFNFGRPCMHPYPYAPYPGFVLPNAPLYPMGYRRMLEPRFQASPWGDVPHQHHHHPPPPPPPQPHGRRETTCSGAQTDPSDAITKLIECLDKIRATELQNANRELDSGIASQSSGVFSPGEEKKTEEQSHAVPSAPLDRESSAVTSSESTVYNKSREMILDPLNPQGWAGRLEEELPLDSSSIQEESPEPSTSNVQYVSLEKEEVVDIRTSISMTDSSVHRFDAEEHRKSFSSPLFASSQLAQNESKSCEEVSKLEDLVACCGEPKPVESYQILKLPFDGVLSPGARHLSSPGPPYHYSYLPMQTTHERMSVLSPSLDELSSRDEMFSTDLDDVDLFPSHVYASRRLTEVVTGSPRATNENDEWFSGSKRSSCACCGRSLTKGTSRSKVHSSKMYQDEGGDSDVEGGYGRGCEQPVRVVVRKHSAPRKSQSTPRHAAKPWCKRDQYKELSELAKQEEEARKVETAEAEAELNSSDRQCRTCQDGLFREDLTPEDQGGWMDGDVIPRRKHAAPLQRQETSTQWKMMYHRPRDENHDQTPPLHWERCSPVRDEPRC